MNFSRMKKESFCAWGKNGERTVGIMFFDFLYTFSLSAHPNHERKVHTMSKINTTPGDQKPANQYDDGNIPKTDLPKDVIPDEVPRKDGPGGGE